MPTYLCSEGQCPMANMNSQFAGEHSERTGHKVVVQTPEAMFEHPAHKEKSKSAVARFETRMSKYIIQPAHDEHCRCETCWNAFQQKWSRGN